MNKEKPRLPFRQHSSKLSALGQPLILCSTQRKLLKIHRFFCVLCGIHAHEVHTSIGELVFTNVVIHFEIEHVPYIFVRIYTERRRGSLQLG